MTQSTSNNIEIPQGYEDWFNRFKRILNVYKAGKIEQKDLIHYQLYLLETGQFNASFSLEELDRLGYSKSPFAVRAGHSYLRATDTWAMEILRMHYKEENKNNGIDQEEDRRRDLYPVWVNSKGFWEAMQKHCTVIKLDEFRNNINKLEYDNNKIYWVEVDKVNKKFPNLRKIKQELDKKSEIPKRTVYFYREDNFKGMNAIVMMRDNRKDQVKVMEIDGKSSFIYANQLINSLGYRLDPVKVIKILIGSYYRNLFVDYKDTNNFFNNFNNTSNISDTKLSKEERGKIISLEKLCISEIKNQDASQDINTDTHIENIKYYHEYLSSDVISILPNNFKLYGQIIEKFIKLYLTIDVNTFIELTAGEIERNIDKFFKACEDNDLSQAVRATQTITEILQLHLNTKGDNKSFESIVKEEYLKDFPVQGAFINAYAMKAFTNILSIIDINQTTKISLTNQSYYEILENFEKVNNLNNNVNLIRHTKEIKQDSNLIFLELHPNNVVETKQFAHDVLNLITRISSWNDNMKRTIVIDITLNALNDPEVTEVLNKAKSLIEAGELNIILIQSLTKFAQMGLDQRSGGLISIINNGENWQEVNDKFQDISKIESVDPVIERYFSYFASEHADLLKTYLEQINGNVQYVYNQVIAQMNNLETLSHDRFQVTTSSDPKACYVALNMKSLAADVENGFDNIFNAFSISNDGIEAFSQDLLNYLFYPLCKFMNLPITARESIGFPLSSINIVYDSLRITIGLELRTQLQHYAEILSYISFVLNRQQDTSIFFYKDLDGKESLRIAFFVEKANQFKAMTRGRNVKYITKFDRSGSNNSYNNYNNTKRQLKAASLMKNGEIRIYAEKSGRSGIEWHEFSINVPLANRRVTSLSYKELRMVAGCLTSISIPGKEVEQNSKFEMDMFDNKLSFSSYQITGGWNTYYMYGPFFCQMDHQQTSKKPLYLELFQKEINIVVGDQRYDSSNIILKQGELLIPFKDIHIEDQAFIIREGSYEYQTNLSMEDIKNNLGLGHNQSFDFGNTRGFRVSPSKSAKVNFSIKNGYLIIEHDFPLYEAKGVSIYHRFINDNLTCYEIDYWSEKDPTVARFLRFITAVYVKELTKDKENKEKEVFEDIGFKVRDPKFTHFLFNLDQKNGEDLFKMAVDNIVKNKEGLKKALEKYQKSIKDGPIENNSKQCVFTPKDNIGKNSVQWPSGYNYSLRGTDYINNVESLIKEAIRGVLKLEEIEEVKIEEVKQVRQSGNKNFDKKTPDITSFSRAITLNNAPTNYVEKLTDSRKQDKTSSRYNNTPG